MTFSNPTPLSSRARDALDENANWNDPEPGRDGPVIVKLHPMGVADFLAKAFPPRELVLGPWLPAKGLVMIFAPRGIGKTWVSLNIAWAVATGGDFLGWSAPKPRRVLYIDGEMPGGTLQERLASIARANGGQAPDGQALRFVASDLEEFGIPDLATPEGQAAIDAVLGDADLIVCDNLSTLLRSGKENDSESWVAFQGWLLAKRRQGRSVLLIHHAGKGGAQRGTSKREDILDTVINLKRPSDYEPEQGARFEVHFEKARGFAGPEAEAFEAAFAEDQWTRKDLGDTRSAVVLKLKGEGLTQREIANQTGIALATVNRILKREKDAGNG